MRKNNGIEKLRQFITKVLGGKKAPKTRANVMEVQLRMKDTCAPQLGALAESLVQFQLAIQNWRDRMRAAGATELDVIEAEERAHKLCTSMRLSLLDCLEQEYNSYIVTPPSF